MNHSSLRAQTALFWAIAFSLVFTALIFVLRPLAQAPELLPDQGAAWYYWKLPDPNFWTRLSAWGGYLLHQGFMWGLIYWAQKAQLKYTDTLKPINWIALIGSASFVLLHWLQTAFWYDGLAQDVSVFTSQGSVIILLVMVLVMENQRRGLFWGKKVNWVTEPGRVFRKYHGYVFAWATIYTFWFHPMESTYGHLLGFFYTFMIMIQGSLIFTRAHTNRYWTFALEFFVLIHGTLVAVMQGAGAWPMFFFGFAGIFIVTQMHGLGLKQWQRWLFLLAYCGAIIWVYSDRGWGQVNEVIRIPFIDYLLVFLFAGFTWIGMKLVAYWRKSKPERQAQALGEKLAGH